MNSINSIVPGAKPDTPIQKTGDILLKLEQSGVFRAIVVENRNQHVLLDTAYGKISARAHSNLQKGDEIQARILSRSPEASIKVEQHKPASWILPRQTLNKLEALNVSFPVVAKIMMQTSQSSKLQIGKQAIIIPLKAPTYMGQKVMLNINTKQQLVAKPFNPQSILKEGLTRLLARNQHHSSAQTLTSLQRLAAELAGADTNKLNSRISELSANQPLKPQGQPVSPGSLNALKTDRAAQSEPQLKSITKLLSAIENLAAPALNLQSVKADSIQQLMLFLTLLKPTLTHHQTAVVKTLPEILKALMNQLKASPETFETLMRQVFKQRAANKSATTSDQSMHTVANSLRQELFSQTEQALNQLLFHKTSLALQAEQNQPFQLHLNVPVENQHETRNLKLSITGKNSKDEFSEQQWEVDLSFDFANLGLIHTHIVLQDVRLSARFRAEQEKTWALINHHLHEFQSQIIDSGFQAGMFDCQHGPVVSDAEEPDPLPGGENYVDINV